MQCLLRCILASSQLRHSNHPGSCAFERGSLLYNATLRRTTGHHASKFLSRLFGLRSVPGMIAVVGAGASWTDSSELSTGLSRQSPDYVVRRNSSGRAYGLLSSGSTGRPKLIVHRHQDILYGYFAFARGVLKLNGEDRVVSVAKMTTGYRTRLFALDAVPPRRPLDASPRARLILQVWRVTIFQLVRLHVAVRATSISGRHCVHP